jgi:hypothetical protein
MSDRESHKTWKSYLTRLLGQDFQRDYNIEISNWVPLLCPFCDFKVNPPKESKDNVVVIETCQCGAIFFVASARDSLLMMLTSLDHAVRIFYIVHNFCPATRLVGVDLASNYDMCHDLCHVTFVKADLGGLTW